jgi:tRNA modification GTPase
MDPIVAPATKLISQPVGIVRFSGTDLIRRFGPIMERLPDPIIPRTVYRVRVRDFEGHPLDDGLLIYFKAPASLTGEDVLELQLHGNPHALRRVLDHAYELGARPAKPGEFLYRAYTHQKITLLKSESLNRMILAPSFQEFRRQFQEYESELPLPLEKIRDAWIDVLARLFVLIDHADLDESELPDREKIRESLLSLRDLVLVCRRSYETNRSRWNGFTVVLAGPPNSGKSSLFNRLLGGPRALVSDIPGTTRDMLEGRISTEHGDILLIDSAGIRSTSDSLEKAGIQKSKSAMREASLVLWIESDDCVMAKGMDLKGHLNRIVRVWNKCDLPNRDSPNGEYDFIVSARTKKGVSRLYRFLENQARHFYEYGASGMEPTVSSPRQYRLLGQLQKVLRRVIPVAESGVWEVVLHEMESERVQLEEAIGVVSHDMVYDRVFKSFCIGK